MRFLNCIESASRAPIKSSAIDEVTIAFATEGAVRVRAERKLKDINIESRFSQAFKLS